MTDSFLRTVSAFANYTNGTIIFGVADSGHITGFSDAKGLRLQIEHKINDGLSPVPIYHLSDMEEEGKILVKLSVFRGENTPYTYQNKAYKRNDTSTVKVDEQEFRRLVIDGSGSSFDQLHSNEKNLNFEVLAGALKKSVGVERFDSDTLRTLDLMRQDSYTKGAELLADTNRNAQSRTTIIRFGKTISEFMDRADFGYQSLLSQYQGALNMFDKWYQPYEAVVGFERIQRIQVPIEAFREAIANALLHRRFDLNGAVQISMYEDRIEVLSPGGLPEGMSETSFLYSNLSLPRNLAIAEVFHRLGIIEKFGTGIDRIRNEYIPYEPKPQFQVTVDFIRIILPVVNYKRQSEQMSVGDHILFFLSREGTQSRAAIEAETGYKRTKVVEELRKR